VPFADFGRAAIADERERLVHRFEHLESTIVLVHHHLLNCPKKIGITNMQVEETIPIVEAIKLLEQCNLLTSDVLETNDSHFFGLRRNGELYAVVGVELFGIEGLLRSLAVVDEMRGQGHAGALVAHVESFAKKNGVHSLFLLTNTANQFFAHLGYQPIPRSQAPASIRHTAQFAGLCAASADFMAKTLVSD
jgi:amino-acid N-acetyltransferase